MNEHKSKKKIIAWLWPLVPFLAGKCWDAIIGNANPSINVIIWGITVFIAWLVLIKSEHIAWLTNKKRIHIIGYVIIASLTCWIAGVKYEPPLTNPESTRNKFIRIKKVNTEDEKYNFGLLIEFGVNKID